MYIKVKRLIVLLQFNAYVAIYENGKSKICIYLQRMDSRFQIDIVHNGRLQAEMVKC